MSSQTDLFAQSSFELKLNKPLAFFDLETTGINLTQDRIIEISIVRLEPGMKKQIKTWRVNPGIPIPLESSLIHGIYDKDIADKPGFAEVAPTIIQFFQGCDVCGFNILKFDLPVLIEEMDRVGMDFELTGRRLVDAQKIFHQMEPRTLSAAYKFYCQKDLIDAHSAEADTIATMEVLLAQVQKYEGQEHTDKEGKKVVPIRNDVTSLHQLTTNGLIDLAGRMVRNDRGDAVFNFGKYKGTLVSDVLRKDPSYYDWMMKGEFPAETKKRLTELKLKALAEKR
jgi:DNA polymerase-3 subunit epsilon